MVATEYPFENHQFKLTKIEPTCTVRESTFPFEYNKALKVSDTVPNYLWNLKKNELSLI